MKKKYLQRGNRKLPKTTAIWNLPAAKSCPGKTTLCSKHCYAMKAERIYKQVLPSRNNNLDLSRTDEFVNIISEEIQDLHKKGKIKTVRVHESGDFYSKKYLNKWFDIARQNPEITFYAYTKSWMFDYSESPDNFILFFSTDNTSKFPTPKGITNIAEMVDYKYPTSKEKGFSCWDKKENTNNKCTKCNYCYTKGQNKKVIFYKH